MCFLFYSAIIIFPVVMRDYGVFMEETNMGITIVADAASNLFSDILKEKNIDIKVMSLSLSIGDKRYSCYDDPLDVKAFSKTFYEEMEKGSEIKTSLVSPGHFEEIFKEEIAKGNKVVCFTMAKGISGTYNSACLARDTVNENNNEQNVEVIDSMTAGLGEGLQAIHAFELVKQGKSFEEVVKECEEFKHYVRSDFTVDNIKYLLKTGRVSKALARFVHLLNIKILLKGNSESKIAFSGSAIGMNNAIKQLSKTVLEKIDLEKEQTVYITHCNVLDNALKLKDYLEKSGVKNIEIYFYDLISGAHIGPGSLAVFYVAKDAH